MTQPAAEDEKLTLSTGITVGIRKVSPYTSAAIHRAFPAPEPPIQPVEYGPDDIRHEPNPADPDHQKALQAHNILIAEKMQSVFLRLGVIVEIDEARLAPIRAAMAEVGVDIDEDLHMAYVKHVVVGSQADLTLLGNAIASKSQPTEEAVAAAVATFPSDVSGA